MSSGWSSVVAVLDRPTLRSLVVETNDGIIATAGIVEGFAGAGSTGTALVVAALCSMIAGGLALGGARYAEEVAERDARLALIAEERAQLRRSPEEELAELATLYEAKGLSPALARQVALELSARDALAAHVDVEHHLPLQEIPQGPVVIGAAACVAFALGSAIPLLSVLLTPDAWRAEVTFAAALVSLVATSVFLARVGMSPVRRTLARTISVGLSAMALSLLAGTLLHP